MHFSSPEKRIWLVTDAYAIVVSLQAPIYFRFLALVSHRFLAIFNGKPLKIQKKTLCFLVFTIENQEKHG